MEMSMRLLIAFCMGVAVILAWQSYGDVTRKMIANSSPPLSWLAPISVAQMAPATIAPTTSSPDPQELKTMSADLAAVHQKVDHLSAQVIAGQDHMARELANKLQIATEDIVGKISVQPSQPATARIRKSAR
jgi:hypothetical protein